MPPVERSKVGKRGKPPRRKPPVVAGLDAGPVKDFEALLGEGHDLWADDAEFEDFLADLHRWRNKHRTESRPQ